jgi:anti-sigma factor RsiW
MTDPTDPNCATAPGGVERLQAYVDGELDEADRSEMERRLAADPELARLARDYAAQKRALADALALAAEGAADPYTDTLAAGLAHRLQPPARWRWLRWGATAAALVGLGWWGHDLTRSAGDSVPDLVADAAEIHVLFAEDPDHPVELSPAEAGALAKWMTQQFGERVVVPNLVPAGLTFLGGRLLGSEDGPFAQLLYEARDGSRISLYLSRPLYDTDDTVQLVRIDGLNAGYWQEDDLSYTLVAEGPTDRLLTIASRLGAESRL